MFSLSNLLSPVLWSFIRVSERVCMPPGLGLEGCSRTGLYTHVYTRLHVWESVLLLHHPQRPARWEVWSHEKGQVGAKMMQRWGSAEMVPDTHRRVAAPRFPSAGISRDEAPPPVMRLHPQWWGPTFSDMAPPVTWLHPSDVAKPPVTWPHPQWHGSSPAMRLHPQRGGPTPMTWLHLQRWGSTPSDVLYPRDVAHTFSDMAPPPVRWPHPNYLAPPPVMRLHPKWCGSTPSDMTPPPRMWSHSWCHGPTPGMWPHPADGAPPLMMWPPISSDVAPPPMM